MLVPFDIDTIDSKKTEQEILVKRMINIGRNNIGSPGKIRDVSAILLAKILTRPDVLKSGETEIFLGWLSVEFQSNLNDANQMFLLSGIMMTLVEIFKSGYRADLLPLVPKIFDPILKSQITNKFL